QLLQLLERVIERRLRRETKNQFGFIPRRSMTEAIHLLRSLMKKYKERQIDLHMAFLDLEKAYDSVPHEVVWKTLIDKGTPRRYSRVIRICCRTIVREEDIRKRWGEYFSSLFNKNPFNESRAGVGKAVGSSSPHMHYECYYSRINQGELKTALKKMGEKQSRRPRPDSY
nr:integrator complex subunit 11 [Tanacetum cinerariifolium]